MLRRFEHSFPVGVLRAKYGNAIVEIVLLLEQGKELLQLGSLGASYERLHVSDDKEAHAMADHEACEPLGLRQEPNVASGVALSERGDDKIALLHLVVV